MARAYVKNERGRYVVPPHERLEVWLGLSVLGAVTLSWLARLVDVTAWAVGAWLLVLALAGGLAYRPCKRLIKARSVSRWLNQVTLEARVTKTLLETMTVNRLKDSPKIEVPGVVVTDHSPSHFLVEIEKLPGMYALDELKQDLSASFRGKQAGYAVVSSVATEDGNWFKFLLQDVATNKAWIPLKPFRAKKYMVRLQSGLSLDLTKRPHIAIWGRTGSGKSTLVQAIVHQLLSSGTDVRFIDGKTEFYSLTKFYPSEKIAIDKQAVLRMLQEVETEVTVRQRAMSIETMNHNKMGMSASDFDIRPVVLVADEVGSVRAQMETKEAKEFVARLMSIIQRGRSVGVYVIVATQDPSTDTLPQTIRAQFGTKILLGSANADTQRMALGEVVTAGQVGPFMGFYVCDGLTDGGPQRFFVPDLRAGGFNDLKAFERSWRIGQGVKYQQESYLV